MRTVQTVHLLTPSAAPRNPRGARLASALIIWVANAWARSLKRRGTQAPPQAEEAAPARRLVMSVSQSGPGFAADLHAPASRHEALTH